MLMYEFPWVGVSMKLRSVTALWPTTTAWTWGQVRILVSRCLESCRLEKHRRLLPARFRAHLVLAMRLFPQDDYLEVLRLEKAGDPILRPWAGGQQVLAHQGRSACWWPLCGECR
ncbi:transposase domain-containing protein [Streptomyces celluloflavus]|uniref:transposase domain-containing protein n=1 Tax=Streptomyces celluloflavus TaxID=58344 RepID=UPI0036DB56B5